MEWNKTESEIIDQSLQRLLLLWMDALLLLNVSIQIVDHVVHIYDDSITILSEFCFLDIEIK